MFGKVRRLLVPAAAVLVTALSATPAAALCTPFLCYVDLNLAGGAICNPQVFTNVAIQQNGAATTCLDSYQSAVVEVEVPNDCTGVHVWVEYHGVPQGWTVNIGDSQTNGGFGGDFGSLPEGQNAEVQVLDEILTVFNASSTPIPVDPVATQHLSLRDGALNFVVQNQYLSWGQPYTALATPDLQQLFFLPASPTAPANRTIYVGLNRTIADASRNGCGARRALIHVN